MTFATWLAELRRLLAEDPSPLDEWSDEDVGRYHREGFSPASALSELRFRELAGS